MELPLGSAAFWTRHDLAHAAPFFCNVTAFMFHSGFFWSSSWVSHPPLSCLVFPQSSFSTAHSIRLINYLLITYDARIEYLGGGLCLQKLGDYKGEMEMAATEGEVAGCFTEQDTSDYFC